MTLKAGTLLRAVIALALALALAASLAAAAQAEVLWAVGDGAVPGDDDDALAARVQSEGLDRLLYLGDVYESGTAAEFQTRYAPGFGRFKPVTSPTPGNHEWANRAQGYEPYWGELAPRNDGGHWYSYDYADWHIVSLNSEESTSASSRQAAWLRQDLARYDGTCTIAFWHKPRFSAGSHGDSPATQPLWDALAGHAVMVLSGHDHNYQRLKPVAGITQFVVGSGGRHENVTVNPKDTRLAYYNDTSVAALRLQLSAGLARRVLVGKSGGRYDTGSTSCRPHSFTQGRIAPPGAAPAAVRPSIRITAPRRNHRYRRGTRLFRGTTTGAVAPVRLTIVQRARKGGACTVFDGRRMRRASCSTSRSVRVPGLARWSKRLRGLPRGGYRVTARVKGSSGGTASATVRFTIR
jgi:hypothetical protein